MNDDYPCDCRMCRVERDRTNKCAHCDFMVPVTADGFTYFVMCEHVRIAHPEVIK